MEHDEECLCVLCGFAIKPGTTLTFIDDKMIPINIDPKIMDAYNEKLELQWQNKLTLH